MDQRYPAGPAGVPADFTKPSASYTRKAWLAMAGLLLFVGLYAWLSGWFAWQAWRLMSGAVRGGDGVGAFLVGLASAFLAVFMLKALFFVKHGGEIEDLEVTAQEEPELFAFLHRLADEAGAPRPHRVFLSPRVNAAVFYDLSLLNLFWPSKKNLEIGLPLANALNLGELKAVLAHEFGHFAQRSMAVGRWVYIAQQVAGHIIAKRDALDRFLQGLSRFDIRVAWVGWGLSLIIWSIRSLLETAFRLVVIAQRALSREMEMQADRVAVSLTGSDALVHALHRMQAAEESWDRSLAYANVELRKNHLLTNFFALQTRVVEHLRVIMDDPTYGAEPPIPGERPEAHRVFRAELARPPKMWATHPLSHEREENAKRIYLPAPGDGRSAWTLFADPTALAERMTAHLSREIAKEGKTTLSLEEALAGLDREFGAEFLDRRYRGVFLGRSAVRYAATKEELYGPESPVTVEALASLYPESLSEDMNRLREWEKEAALLESLQRGTMTTEGGVVRHRGAELRRRDLPRAIAQVRADLAALNGRLWEHDRRCRTLHRAAARALGLGWPAYLESLAALVHFADHARANLLDAYEAYNSVLAVETATRKVSTDGANQIIAWANTVHGILNDIHLQRNFLKVDATVLARLGAESWSDHYGPFDLRSASLQNINEWVKVVDGWVQAKAGRLALLRDAALGQLLHAEARVAEAFAAGGIAEEAPEPSTVPKGYGTLQPGRERERQTRLGWWARFQRADGPFATGARLLAAAAIIAAVLGFGARTGTATLSIYNGLGRKVVVKVDGQRRDLTPFSHDTLDLPADGKHQVEAFTAEGQPIEAFPAPLDGRLTHYVYNVAAASPLVEWTATYGNRAPVPERHLGAKRWQTTAAEVVFEEPPRSIKTEGGGGTRSVLTGLADRGPGEMFGAVDDEAERHAVVLAHARWEPANSPYVVHWLTLGRGVPGFPAVLQARLKEHPLEVATLRCEQDATTGAEHEQVLARQRELLRQSPDSPDLQYLMARAIVDRAERDRAFLEGERRWPQHPWFAYAAGHVHAERADWPAATTALDKVRRLLPPLADPASMDLARIRRFEGRMEIADLQATSPNLRAILALEKGEGMEKVPMGAYAELAQGRLDAAVARSRHEVGLGDRILRLAAASDGASPRLVQEALALPATRALDPDSAWPMLALALRQKADAAPYRRFEDLEPEEQKALSAFVDALAAGEAPGALEARLTGLLPGTRGRAYGIGLVFFGRRAPQSWRNGARRLLFAVERPYFTP